MKSSRKVLWNVRGRFFLRTVFLLVPSISQNEVWIKQTFNVELQITHLSGSKKVLRKNFQRNRGKKEIKVSERRKWEWEKEDRKERKKEKKGRDFTGRWSTNHTSTKEEHDSLFSLFYDLWRRVSETFSLRWMEKETENWKRERDKIERERELSTKMERSVTRSFKLMSEWWW